MATATAPAPGTPPPPPAAIPHQELLHALARASAPLLRGEEARVCIAGPPGSGKSGLLREFLPELHRAAAGRGLPLPVYFVDGRTTRTAYGLLAALVRLAGGREPASGWSWGRLVESWRARVPGPAVVAVDHADEAEGVERLLRALAPSRGGLLLAVRSGSNLARRQPGCLLLALRPPPPPPPVPVEGAARDLPSPRGQVLSLSAHGPAPQRSLHSPAPSLPAQDPVPQRPLQGPAPVLSAQDPGSPPSVQGLASQLSAHGSLASLPAQGLVPRPSPQGPVPSPSIYGPASPHLEMWGRSQGEGRAPPPGGSSVREPPPARRVALLDDAPRLLLALLAREEGKATTGHLWRAYRRAAPGAGLRPLTLRRISGLLRELEAADLVSAPVLSRGRKGRTKWAILTEEARRTLEEMETAAPPFGEDGPATEG